MIRILYNLVTACKEGRGGAWQPDLCWLELALNLTPLIGVGCICLIEYRPGLAHLALAQGGR